MNKLIFLNQVLDLILVEIAKWINKMKSRIFYNKLRNNIFRIHHKWILNLLKSQNNLLCKTKKHIVFNQKILNIEEIGTFFYIIKKKYIK